MVHRDHDRHIVAGLVKALDWFDNSLQGILREGGHPTVHRTQSMILVHIASGIQKPAEIAREMGLSRQNIHQMARALIEARIIEQRPDAADVRVSTYQFTDDANCLRTTVLRVMAHLENVLAARIGARRVDGLRDVLAEDWGPEVTTLQAALARSDAQAARDPANRRGKRPR